MDDEEKIDAKYAPLVKSYNDKIEGLSTIVSNLEDKKRDLDKKLENHEINKIEYQKQIVLLNEILKDIEIKIVLQGDVTRDLNDLVVKKSVLQKECNDLDILVNSKKEYVIDIEKYPALIKTLQNEMESFQNEHVENKKKATQELLEIKSDVKKIHEHIGVILI